MAKPRRAAGLLLLLAIAALVADGHAASSATRPARRVVSMNPSLSSMLVALGAASTLVGIEEHAARLHPELAAVPVVGGLFNPSLEAVVAVQPDLVVLVPSAEQRDFSARLADLGIEVLALPNLSVAQILESLEILGARVGRVAEARARTDAILRAFADVRAAAAKSAPVRAVVVLQRDPLFVVGAGSFIDEMLRAAGVQNVAAELGEAYPRAAVEWLIAAAPEVILDASDEPPEAARYWQRWPSLPAVVGGGAVALPRTATFPGPYIDRSLEAVVQGLRAGTNAGRISRDAAELP